MMDMATWPQQIGLGEKPAEEMVSSSSCSSKAVLERKARPQKEQALHCPRCNSTNTKFCYYNNYSLSQPRYFCKTCRRYWTEGGSLRNVPVGGGSRKNKRSISKKLADLTAPTSLEPSPNPNNHEGQDLNLAYPLIGHDFQGHHHPGLPSSELADYENPTSSNPLSALDLMRNGLAAGGLGSFMAAQDSSSHYGSGNTTPSLGFLDFMNPAVDSLSGYTNLQGIQGTGRLGFPLGDLRQVSSQVDLVEQDRTQVGASGYWTGVLGGSAAWAHVPNYGP